MIPGALRDTHSADLKAAIGCCKCVYWLCKQEIAHTPTYPHLLELAQSLGCEYFKALNVGRNATYTSPQIVKEFIEVIDGIVGEEVLETCRKAPLLALWWMNPLMLVI